MNQNESNSDYMDTPEEFMKPTANDPFPIDAINCAQIRASAILSMLVNEIATNDMHTLSSVVVNNALWAVEGYLNQIKIMVDHSYHTMHPYIPKK